MKFLAKIKPFLKSLLVLGLVTVLAFGDASSALAARTGGRIGGGGFRAPSRSLTSPAPRTYSPGGYGYGGGVGLPFIMPMPMFWVGGGGILTLFVFLAVANILMQAGRSSTEEGGYISASGSTISVTKVQVGLLASARYLQKELNTIAQTADTASPQGQAEVLQESTLALLRHPEYWAYGATESQKAGLASAEAKFNQWALAERSKFSLESLSNVNNQLRQASPGSLATTEDSGEYIVVTIVVGVDGQINLPVVNNSQDLRQAISQIGSIGSDRLLGVEVLWTPQADGDVLSKEDVLVQYPTLKIV